MTTPNPYLIPGPALISFSGGRTSAFMLRQILDAYDGRLPEDLFAVFANTGKEREETLRFVYECGRRWDVAIHWVEYRARPYGVEGRKTPAIGRFNEVGYNSASRVGEPFIEVIRRKQMLPNVAARFCTSELKIKVMAAFMTAKGFDRFTNVLGLRADEVRRIAKLQRQNEVDQRRLIAWPMLHAGITKRDIWKFWLGANADPKHLTAPLPQGFDLGLYPYEGNCDGCFLKGRSILAHQERERPGYLDWWIDTESHRKGNTRHPQFAQFSKRFSYADLKDQVETEPLLMPLGADLEFDVECGVGGTDTRIRCGARDGR